MLATKPNLDTAVFDKPLAPVQADLRVVAQNPHRRTKINVVLFSGGSGTQSITEAFLRHPQISLKILINAYDDGHSTGRLRRFLPGMLGPSDVRKNLSRLMPVAERGQKALKLVSDHRLPVGMERADALAIIDRIIAGEFHLLPEKIATAFPKIAHWQLRTLGGYLETFRNYFYRQEELGRTFNFTDCALGNLFFAGCYLEQDLDFNRTIDAFSAFHEVEPGILLNITQGENLFLVAEKENGHVLLNEADIVAAQDTAKIRELFLVDEATYLHKIENQPEPEGGWLGLVRAGDRVPKMNPAAIEALASADVIVYGPGTQHSSLFPSYMTAGVVEAVAANTRADKVFIGNIFRDFDIQEDDASDLARKLLDTMTRKGQAHAEWTDVVSHFFVQGTDGQGNAGQNDQLSKANLTNAKYVPFDKSRFTFPLETVKVRDWESQEGRHSGGYVVDELRQIVQSRIDIELAQVHHMVSIVVPVLNEEATIAEVLKSLQALDFQKQGMTKEIIVVDGGSTDRTFEQARSVPGIRVYTLEGSARGRGAAMRRGLDKSRGNLVVFFPGDNEYRPEDVYNVVTPLLNSRFKAVLGTRAVKCTNLNERLHQVYDDNRKLYLTSKYGGILLSVATLLLYNRYVSDVLSSVKGYDAHLLKSLALESDGLDFETEVVAKLSKHREYLLETPVDYKPRTRTQGKKIRATDGLRALYALLKYRFAN